MKKLKRVKAAPVTVAQRRENQRLHRELPHDPEIAAEGRAVAAELRARRIELAGIGPALREARETRGLSLQDISDRTGITRGSLSLLENDKGNPTITTLRRIAEAIGVEILVTVR